MRDVTPATPALWPGSRSLQRDEWPCETWRSKAFTLKTSNCFFFFFFTFTYPCLRNPVTSLSLSPIFASKILSGLLSRRKHNLTHTLLLSVLITNTQFYQMQLMQATLAAFSFFASWQTENHRVGLAWSSLLINAFLRYRLFSIRSFSLFSRHF